jgi:hypothetical protein
MKAASVFLFAVLLGALSAAAEKLATYPVSAQSEGASFAATGTVEAVRQGTLALVNAVDHFQFVPSNTCLTVGWRKRPMRISTPANDRPIRSTFPKSAQERSTEVIAHESTITPH